MSKLHDHQITSATLSTKHLTLDSGVGKTPQYITSDMHHGHVHRGFAHIPARWLGHEHGYSSPYFFNPFVSVLSHASRYTSTALWEAMFGKPNPRVWNRFVRSFTITYLCLTHCSTHISSYWDMDWMSNVVNPRVNQYDPVDYFDYCETHLKYKPARKSKWEIDLEEYGILPALYWMPSIRNPFENTLYEIDDNCKAILAEMFPVKYQVSKRIHHVKK